VVSVLIAMPTAWYFINGWLEQFAYKIKIDFAPFVYAVLLIVFVSSLIISALSFRSASVNPSKNLNSE